MKLIRWLLANLCAREYQRPAVGGLHADLSNVGRDMRAALGKL